MPVIGSAEGPFGDRFRKEDDYLKIARMDLLDLGFDPNAFHTPEEIKRPFAWRVLINFIVVIMISKATNEFLFPYLVGILQMLHWDLRTRPEELPDESAEAGEEAGEEETVEVALIDVTQVGNQARQLLVDRRFIPPNKGKLKPARFRPILRRAVRKAIAEANTLRSQLEGTKTLLSQPLAQRPEGWQAGEMVKLLEALSAVSSTYPGVTEIGVRWQNWHDKMIEQIVKLMLQVAFPHHHEARPTFSRRQVRTICHHLTDLQEGQMLNNKDKSPKFEQILMVRIRSTFAILANCLDYPHEEWLDEDPSGGE